MKSLAIVFDGDINNLKGKVNAIINRIHYLSYVADYRIDVFSIQFYDSFLSCFFKKKRFVRHQSGVINVDGIQVKVVWLKSHFIDLLLTSKLRKKPYFREWQLKYSARFFSQYDAVSAHSFNCSDLANVVSRKYHIPYFCTWHGSEIHSIPTNYRFQYNRTAEIIKGAKCNFFVSNALVETAKNCIIPVFNYKVLYNGVSSSFVKYKDEERLKLREKYGVSERKVVSFVGNLIDVKNPLLLAPIFERIKKLYNGEVQFWVIGDGSMRDRVEKGLKDAGIDYKMWGNQPASLMPELYQCIDAVILISKNEGLPLTLPEAIACGANAVGAKVGGIPEVLTADYVFEHGSDFVEKVSDRVTGLLENPQSQTLGAVFSWENTAKIEDQIYRSVN